VESKTTCLRLMVNLGKVREIMKDFSIFLIIKNTLFVELVQIVSLSVLTSNASEDSFVYSVDIICVFGSCFHQLIS
jgi:hypothetical protein